MRDAYEDRAVDPKVMAFGLSTATIEDSGIDREPLDLLTIDTFAEVIRELASLDDGFDLVVDARSGDPLRLPVVRRRPHRLGGVRPAQHHRLRLGDWPLGWTTTYPTCGWSGHP